MERLQTDLFPADFKKTANLIFGGAALAATLLEQPPAESIPTSLSSDFFHETSLLHSKEITKFKTYQLAKRRAEFLTGRICAKLAIKSFWTSCNRGPLPPLKKIEITNDPSGRPHTHLHGQVHWPFPEISISHGGKYAAALAADCPCGIDIQQQRDNLLRIRDKFCYPEELQLLSKTLPHLATLSHLAILWTAKEAAKKALSHLQMPGFLELNLIQLDNHTSSCYSLTMAVMARGDTRMPQKVKVLATFFTDYGLAICILAPTKDTPDRSLLSG